MTGKRLARFSLALLTAAVSVTTLHAQEGPAAPDVEAATAPVVIDGVELFRVRGVSSYPAATRAATIEARILEAARDPNVAIDSLRLVESPGALRVMAGDHLIMGVVEADAAVEDVARQDVAAAHVLRLRSAIAEYREARSPAARYGSMLRTVITVVALGALLGLVSWGWRRVDDLLRRRVQARIQTVGIQSFEVMRAERIHAAFQMTLRVLHLITYFACVAVALGYVLSSWPSTRGLSRGVAGLALEPLRTIGVGVVANIPRLAFLAVLFLLVRVALRLLRLFFAAVERGTVTLSGFDAEWSQPTYNIVRVAVVAFGVIVAYPYIPGSQSEAFKGVSLFIGIIFSLGSSSAISNIIAGYTMTYRRAFKIGDRVKIGDSIGDVIITRLQVTHLRSVKNEEIVIPNSQILNGEVLNYSSLARDRGLLLHTEVGIGYDTSWRHVQAMLLEAAGRTPGLGSRPAPFVLLKRLGDFAVVYELNVPCGEVQAMTALYTALHQQVLDVFNEHGVQIMTPAYEGDPPEPKIVPVAERPTSLPVAAPAILG